MARAHSLEGLMAWSRRPEWRERFQETLARHVAAACKKFAVPSDDLPELLGPMGGNLFGCAFEDFLTLEEDGQNVVDDYLKRRGWNEGPSDRAYMEGLRHSVMSLYEASDIVPGKSVLVRDLVRGGDPVRVTEGTATRTLRQWDRIAARLIPTGAGTVFSGGLLPLDTALATKVLASLRRVLRQARSETRRMMRAQGHAFDETILREATSETALLCKSAFLITNHWLDFTLQRMLSPKLPQFANSEGDPLVFLTASYPLDPAATPAELRKRLATLPALRPEGRNFWNWLAEKDSRPPRRHTGPSFVSTMEDGSLVLGTLELKGRKLMLQVNSHPRLARARALIDPLLAGLVREPKIRTETPAQLKDSKRAPPPEPPLPPAEERRIVHASLERHYRETLDLPIPALGNLSPRDAARTAKGRAKVADWLKMLENHTARQDPESPMGSYDFAWMWEELGLSDRRR